MNPPHKGERGPVRTCLGAEDTRGWRDTWPRYRPLPLFTSSSVFSFLLRHLNRCATPDPADPETKGQQSQNRSNQRKNHYLLPLPSTPLPPLPPLYNQKLCRQRDVGSARSGAARHVWGRLQQVTSVGWRRRLCFVLEF
ncbi:hypothetical protein E2C01_085001 [Portunus trituberculatus]|uniref:Uncharacterized protein n=1 Tax=Portunus trituberculatus TaxID=210409 RepID=A0A5B7JCD7_PORTR|nr:hypothetical protein [Portunus trituberculatus]